jgi:AGZA family xanthine/uracil permease-like MFS transporter
MGEKMNQTTTAAVLTTAAAQPSAATVAAIPVASAQEHKPENIFYILLPVEWKNKLKDFNRDLSTLTFIKKTETPAFLKSTSVFLDNFFNCTGRGSSVGVEIFAGIINFLSCMYILAALPNFMAAAGYNSDSSLAVISLACGMGNILSGIVSNLPIIISPPVPISIYFTSSIQQYGLSVHQGNMVVVYSGIFFLIMAVLAPFGRFMARVIPDYIQLGTTIGIGLFTVLYGFIDLGLVKPGRYTLLELGSIDSEVIVGISAIIITAWGIITKSKISLLAGLAWGTVIWWTSQNMWPAVWTSVPLFHADNLSSASDPYEVMLIFELFILDLITCFGMCTALCKLGDLLTKEGMVPNGRFLSVVVGITNIFSGVLNGPPIVVSPESAAGIRAGAKTGLSTVVAGILFLFTLFFGPFFSSIPAAGTSPILVMTGLLLVKNVQNVDFMSRYAVPAYMCLTLIPFTNSIFAGIGVGMACYLIISIVTGQFVVDGRIFLNYYFPEWIPLVPDKGDTAPETLTKDPEAAIDGVSVIGAAEDVTNPLASGATSPVTAKSINDDGSPVISSRSRRASSISQGVQQFARRGSSRLVASLADSSINGSESGLMLNS